MTADDITKIITSLTTLIAAVGAVYASVQSARANFHAKAAVDLTNLTNEKVDKSDAKVDAFKSQVDGRMTEMITTTKEASFAAGAQSEVAQAAVKAVAFAAGQQSIMDQNMTADIAASPVHVNGVQKVEIVQAPDDAVRVKKDGS